MERNGEESSLHEITIEPIQLLVDGRMILFVLSQQLSRSVWESTKLTSGSSFTSRFLILLHTITRKQGVQDVIGNRPIVFSTSAGQIIKQLSISSN